LRAKKRIVGRSAVMHSTGDTASPPSCSISALSVPSLATVAWSLSVQRADDEKSPSGARK
jgi:hypothetical protein